MGELQIPATTPEITVIVTNWNTRDLLRRCLDSVAETADSLTVQAIVVDNGSHDGSQSMLHTTYPWVELLANTSNVGFARANNQGLALALAPLLLLLNSDAAVVPGALRTAIDFMETHPDVGIAGLQLLNDDLTLQPSGKRFPTLLSIVVGLLPVPRSWRMAYDSHRNRRDYTQAGYVDEVSGAAMVVRHDLFEMLRGFDERFYFFGEDIDLCWRARERGYVVAYLPAAKAIHSWGGARTHIPSIRQGLLSQRAQYQLFRRHAPVWQSTILRSLLIVLTMARVARAVAVQRRGPVTGTRTTAHLYVQEVLWLLRN